MSMPGTGLHEILKRRIRACIKKIPEQTVQAASVAVRKRMLPQGASKCLPLTISVQNCPNFNIVSFFCNHPFLT